MLPVILYPTNAIDGTVAGRVDHHSGTDAHCLTLWRRSAAMTAENPWTSLGVATGDRRNLQVSTASAMAHGTSTANATVAATARALVLSVANSVVPTMATLGSPRQLPRQFPRKLPRKIRGLPWVLQKATVGICGFPRQMPRLRPRHVHWFCPWQTPS